MRIENFLTVSAGRIGSEAAVVAGGRAYSYARLAQSAERIAVATYSEIVRWLANDDPTTRRIVEEILAKEEEHADDLAKLLEHIGTH